MIFASARIPLLALAATVASLLSFWAFLSRPETLLDRSLAAALKAQPHALDAAATGADSPLADSDLLRLSSLGGASPFGRSRHVAVGDRITIAGRDGELRTLEVVDVRALQAQVTRSPGGAETHFLLVTCSVVGLDPGPNVRFIVEDVAPEPSTQMLKAHRAL